MKICIFLLILISEIASSYPTTISKGYQTCDTCHITPSGGTILNDYGRAMSSDFMSTFSVEDEAREFLFAESQSVDAGVDYRHLLIQEKNRPSFNFPMLLDFDGAVHFGDLTIASSIGYYSRNRDLESRESYAQFKVFPRTHLRAGYFMPVMGINTNDHSLSIKRLTGLSRGSETYNIEFHHANEYFQIFYTSGAKEFSLKEDEKNFYRLSNPEGSRTDRLRMSLLYFKRGEVGVNYVSSQFINAKGFFIKHSLFKGQYFFYERDWTDDEVATYSRLGIFPVRGIDTYFEADLSKTINVENKNIYFGIDWMVRPRFELSLKINLTGNADQFQTHLWM